MKGERGFRRGKTSSFHSQRKPQVHVEGTLRNVSFVRSLVVSSFSISELKAENPVLFVLHLGFIIEAKYCLIFNDSIGYIITLLLLVSLVY